MQIKRTSLLAAMILVLYVVAVERLDSHPRQRDPRELDAVLPRSAQLALVAGDRYLASNLATIRALVVSTANMTPDQYALLAKIQGDAAWFNPANEDNYYVAANLLPWNGQLEGAQEILGKTIEARPFDWLPAFYYAFDLWYFKHDAGNAAKWLRKAMASTADENDRIALEVMAARWIEHGYNTGAAIRLLQAQENETKHSRLRDYFRTRITRLEGLQVLEQAADAYVAQTGRPPVALDDLVHAKLIAALPVDPWQFGYDLDQSGRPVLLYAPKKK